MPTLQVINGQFAGKEFKIDNDVIIGRGSMTDIVIEDPTMSRRHSIIAKADNDYILSDLQSGNGTKLNGAQIKAPTTLADGDQIRLGNVIFQFSNAGQSTTSHVDRPIVTISDEDNQAREVLQVMDADNLVTSLIGGIDKGPSKDDQFHAMIAMSRRLQLIYDIGEATSSTLNEDELLESIMEKLFDIFPQADRGFIMQLDPENNQLLPKVARTRTGEVTEITVSRTVVKDVIENRRGILSADAMGDDRFSMGQSIMQFEIRSVICVPMIAKNQILGVIHVDASDPKQPFEKDDMALLLGIAGQAGLALINAQLHQKVLKQELLEQDLLLANRIQHHFLPKTPPEVEGYEFRDDYNAALEVGGDYYDFIQLSEDHIGIVVGDVSGKGVSAALYMAKLSSDVRFNAVGETEPKDILMRLNSVLSGDVEEGMFVTLIFLSLNIKTGEMKFANAGHLPPMIRRVDGEVITLGETGNFPLGISDTADYEQESFQLEPGDTVAVYTDGIYEATNPEDELFGFDRVEKAMKDSDGTPGGMLEKILSEVKTFFREAPQNDDITLVCFGPEIPDLEFG